LGNGDGDDVDQRRPIYLNKKEILFIWTVPPLELDRWIRI
jgi:hypothetical protein